MQSPDLENKVDDKFIDLVDSPAVEVAEFITSKYGIYLLLSDLLKVKMVSGRIPLEDLKSSLNAFSWLLNCEYNFKDNIYYFGGKSIVYEIKSSNGLNDEIKSNFSDSVACVLDKFIIKGNENEVKNISDTVNKLSELHALSCWIYICQYTYKKGENIGVNAQPNIKGGSLSYDDMKNHTISADKLFGDPKIDFTVKNDFEVLDKKILIDTSLGCISGKKTEIIVGKQEDRQIYTAAPAGGQTSQFVSNYQSNTSGLSFKLTPYKTDKGWVINSFVENSVQDTNLIKTLVQLTSTNICNSGDVVIIGKINVKTNQEKKSGILYKMGWNFLDWILPADKSEDITDIVIVLGIQ